LVEKKKKVEKTEAEKQAEKAQWSKGAKKEDSKKDPNAKLDPEYLKQFLKQKIVRTNNG